MKKLILSAIALTVAGLASAQTATTQPNLSPTASPYNGQYNGIVRFNGQVIDQTCVVKTDRKDQTVNLGKVTKEELNTKGHAGSKNFTISLEQCNTRSAHQKVRAEFLGSDKVDPTTFALRNIHVATVDKPKANNVQLRLKERNGTIIRIGDGTYTPTSLDYLDLANKAAGEIQYAVEYFKAGNEGNSADVTEGHVHSEVEYAIVYE